MEISKIDVWSLLLIMGAAQGLILLFVLLISKRGNRKANLFLSILLFILILNIIEYLSISSGVYNYFPHLYGLKISIWYLIGPLIFYYTKLLITKNYKFKKIYLLHLIPFFIFLVFSFDIFLLEKSQKIFMINLLKADRAYFPNLVNQDLLVSLQSLHLFSYLLATIYLIKKYRKSILDNFSNIERINLFWLKTLIIDFIIILVVYMIVYLLIPNTSNVDYFSFEKLFLLTISSLLTLTSIFSLNQPEIYLGDLSENIGLSFKSKVNKKYEKSVLTKELSEKILNKIIKYMKEDKPFLEDDFSLNKLSDKISTIPNYVSQVINESLNLNFFDFVNGYRIVEAKKLITNNSENKFTFLQIAYEVGYNSKSAFNRAFKKHTKLTPTKFKNQLVA